jgi:hypothetical protein
METKRCLCVQGCTVNGICPVHGDAAMPIRGYSGINSTAHDAAELAKVGAAVGELTADN